MRLSSEDHRLIHALAEQHRLSVAAVEALFCALVQGQGRAAQFNHPELGGMGQWMAGGMLMIGDLANHQLKATVAQLCAEIAAYLQRSNQAPAPSAAMPPMGGQSDQWWPAAWGVPNARGGQGAMQYAYFAAARRLAIRDHNHVRVYDTGPHAFHGVAQQQGDTWSVRLLGQGGDVVLDSLAIVYEYDL